MSEGAQDAGNPFDPKGAARAIDAMRRGWPIRISGSDGAATLLPVEGADDAGFAAFGAKSLLISGERAATLKLINQRAAASPGPVRLALMPDDTVARAVAIADPALDLMNPMKGPFVSEAVTAPDVMAAAIHLARLAHRLPAWFIGPDDATVAAETSVEAITDYADPRRIQLVARARLPVEASEVAEIVAFRTPEEAQDHVALIIGKRDGSVPVVRLHSECLTGDIFGSLKCDCGPQLHAALHEMAHNQWGVLLYLRQEGRGIGLVNKLRAYQLQDQGFDTVDANTRLGFPVEARDFGIAAQMLDLLGIGTVKLMTNNPAKVERLRAEGVTVTERLPVILPTNPHNERYLATKRDRTGHQL